MTLKYAVLCLFALLIVVILTFKNYETWTVAIDAVPEKAAPKKQGVKPDGPQPLGDQKDAKAAPSIASYIFISDKNPFHPDRKEFPIFIDPKIEASKRPRVRPQVTLYGVTIVDDYRSASISYPGRPLQKGEREVFTVKIGDRVGEYKLAKILEDRIGLEAPEDSYEVLLYDANIPKKRVYVKTEIKPATVTSTVAVPPAAAPEGAKPAATPPVGEAVAAAPAPAPLTPAATPAPATSRTRRLVGPRPSTPAPSGE